jgi:hypothetical protein
MGYGQTAYNRSVYASPPYGGSGYEKPQSGYALCAVFLRHILRLLVFASQSPYIPAQTSVTAIRYVQLFLKFL